MFSIFLSRYKDSDVNWTQIRHSKHQCNESLTMMRLQEIYLTKDKKIHPQVYYADTQCRGQCFYSPRGIIMDEVSPTAGGEIKLPKITLCGEVSPPDKCGWARNF